MLITHCCDLKDTGILIMYIWRHFVHMRKKKNQLTVFSAEGTVILAWNLSNLNACDVTEKSQFHPRPEQLGDDFFSQETENRTSSLTLHVPQHPSREALIASVLGHVCLSRGVCSHGKHTPPISIPMRINP